VAQAPGRGATFDRPCFVTSITTALLVSSAAVSRACNIYLISAQSYEQCDMPRSWGTSTS